MTIVLTSIASFIVLKNGLARLSGDVSTGDLHRQYPGVAKWYVHDGGFSWFHQPVGTWDIVAYLRWKASHDEPQLEAIHPSVYPHMYDIKSKEVQSITPYDRPDRFRKTCEIMLNSYRDLRQNQS